MRRLLQILAVLVGLAVVAVVAAVVYVDRIAAEVIERGGRHALGVEVSVDGVSIGLLSGTFRVRGLEIHNPEGFEGPHFGALRELRLDVAPASLLEELVEVPEFAIEGLALRLERRGRRTNAGAILENLRRYESGAPPPEETAPVEAPSAGTQFVVREMVIRDVTAHADLLGGLAKGTPTSVTLPEVRVRDVGSQTTGGVAVARLFDLVVKAVLRAVIEQQNPLSAALRGEIGQRLAQLQDVRAQVVGEAEARARDAAEQARERAGEAAGEAAGRAADEAGRRVRDLFGGGEKEEGSGSGSP